MLFESLTQLWIFLFMLWAGACLALVFNALYMLRRIKVLGHVTDFVFLLLCGFVYIKSVGFCDYGKIGIATISFLVLGFILMHKLGGKVVKVLIQALYNVIYKCYNKLIAKVLSRYIRIFEKKILRQKIKDDRFVRIYLNRCKKKVPKNKIKERQPTGVTL